MLLRNKTVLVNKQKAPLYKTSLWIVVADKVEDAIDAVEDHVHYPILTDKNGVMGLTYTYSDSTISQRVMIFIAHNSSPGTIAHEAYHAMCYILSYHGFKRDRNNDEHEAYYIDTLVTKIHSTIAQFKKSQAAVKNISKCE